MKGREKEKNCVSKCVVRKIRTVDSVWPGCVRAYNRSARSLALNWSPLVGADFSSANRSRDCAARRDFASCVSYLRFNPRHGTASLPCSPPQPLPHSASLSILPSRPLDHPSPSPRRAEMRVPELTLSLSPLLVFALSFWLPFFVTLALLSGNSVQG